MDDDVRSTEICNKLFECMTFMRKTTDGILACTNTRGNVWNVFGGLSRTKKAVGNILTHELWDRYSLCLSSGRVDKRDVTMVSEEWERVRDF